MKTKRTLPPASAEPRLAAPPRGRSGAKKIRLRLYVAGATTRSRNAVVRIRNLCENELAGRCDLKVIDIYQQPQLARLNQIVATPTLIKEMPRPVRRYIGNLADMSDLLSGLDLELKLKAAA